MFLSRERDFKTDFEEAIMKLGRLSSVLKKAFLFK
jgi:hypothetical protein